MRKLGIFESKSEQSKIAIDISKLGEGLHSKGNYIVKITNDRKVDFVINKVCDHAGGRLILKGEKAVCPFHGWELNLESLKYQDSHIVKKKLDFKYQGSELIYVEGEINQHLINPYCNKTSGDGVIFRWLNHACVYVESNGVSFITDPWLFGPAFLTGWWLEDPSTEDSLELLRKADYVLISHNHPDHLHLETLNILEKNKKIIVADFKTKSAEKYLRANGFTNVLPLKFLNIYEIAPGFQVSLIKSGDFRDDSGFYLNANGEQILMTVDCNFLNSHHLPVNVDVLMTAFAGGASGFPLCYNGYDENKKLEISKRNKLATRVMVKDYLTVTKPKYYMPYAGMFKEKAPRDINIERRNAKNSIFDIKKIVEEAGVNFIEPSKSTFFQLKEHKIFPNKKVDIKFLDKESQDHYINNYKNDFKYSSKRVIDYFKKSGFKGDQILFLIPTMDDFTTIDGEIVFANFKTQIFKEVALSEVRERTKGYKNMIMYVRKEIIACVVENKLPWEDISTGFQMRVDRSPNEYESEFWYYFTNVFINDQNFRYSSYCGSCSLIKQSPIFNSLN